MLEALTAGCRDTVLAVCIPAAASLAAFCRMLSQSAAAQPGMGAQLLPACLQLAAAAAGGSDKLRPSGLQALGSLFELRGRLPVQQQQQQHGSASGEEQLLAAAAQAVLDCLSSSNARVQWAACEAAGELLACPAPAVQRHAAAVLQQLLGLLRGCPNFRSRALAAAALRLAGAPALASTGPPAQLLDAVAGVLFDGEEMAGPAHPHICVGAQASARGRRLLTMVPSACFHLSLLRAGKATGFSVAVAAAAPSRSGQGPPPAEQGSKAQLEAALVAAVLHLLALLPEAAAAAAMQLDRSQLARLRGLVQQARRELAPAGQAAEVAAVEAGTTYGGAYFDLSLASPALVEAAARGLALLEQ